NRFYSPDIGRFLQPDPIGFWGGSNLYRDCGNNPVTRRDRFGLQDAVAPTLSDGWTATVDEVKVTGFAPPEPIDRGGTGAPSGGGGGGGGGEAGGTGGSPKLTGITFSYGKPTGKSNFNTQQQPPGIMVGFDIYHPTTTAEFIIAGNIIEGGDTTDTIPGFNPLDFFSWGIAGLVRAPLRRAAAEGIAIPSGRAVQATTAEARAALAEVQNGATVYRQGWTGTQRTFDAQNWALENPATTPNFANQLGMPATATEGEYFWMMGGRVTP